MLTSPADTTLDPRTARSKGKIRAATLRLLGTCGYGRLTIEAIAEEAGVGKATIYRYYDSKAALTVDTISCLSSTGEPPDTGDTRVDLYQSVQGLCTMLTESPWAQVMPTILDASDRDTELAQEMARFRQARRRPITLALQRGIQRGDLRDDLDLELTVDLLVGPVFTRRFLHGGKVDDAFARAVVDHAWAGVGR